MFPCCVLVFHLSYPDEMSCDSIRLYSEKQNIDTLKVKWVIFVIYS